MIRLVIMAVCILLTSYRINAQTLIPFEFTSEEDNHLLKENDSAKCYVSSGDSSQVVCLNEENSFYKLLNKANVVIAEGSYLIEGEKYLQVGKWTERYDNGRIKVAGSYRRNKPIGTWQEFYPTGKVKAIYNYAIVVSERGTTNYCLSGSWQEFYPNGKLQVSGYYSANETKVSDTIIVDDPITDQKITKVSARTEYAPVKAGTWEYYTESGELDRKEEF